MAYNARRRGHQTELLPLVALFAFTTSIFLGYFVGRKYQSYLKSAEAIAAKTYGNQDGKLDDSERQQFYIDLGLRKPQSYHFNWHASDNMKKLRQYLDNNKSLEGKL
jgi:hypothetical protein